MDTIDRLGRIDLNLLVSLYVLLDERNVTRAAERLFITQPAASRTLTRLRNLFDDPLLVRSGSEMAMTARAQLLKDSLPGTLEALGELVAPVSFDPATHEQIFRIAVPEVFGQTLVSPLLAELMAAAPGINLSFTDPDERAHLDLVAGDVDFLIRKSGDRALPAPLHSESLFQFQGTVVTRPAHALVNKRKLTLEQLLKYPWIDCYPGETPVPMGPLDSLLQARGLERKIVFRSTHLLSALQALSNSDCLLFLANTGHSESILSSHCTELAVPREIRDEIHGLEILQHRKTLASEPHRYMKEILLRHAGSAADKVAPR